MTKPSEILDSNLITILRLIADNREGVEHEEIERLAEGGWIEVKNDEWDVSEQGKKLLIKLKGKKHWIPSSKKQPRHKYERTVTRPFSMHVLLMHAASLELESALAKEIGTFNFSLASMIMSAFAVESFCNTVGVKVVPNWNDRNSPLDKLKIICDSLMVQYDLSQEPWAEIKKLFKFRNLAAH